MPRNDTRVSAGAPGWSSDQAISRLAIVKAIPAGSKRARSQRGYLRAVVADPVIAALRADRRRAVLELARILARHADWRTMTSWRPRERACAEIGSSRDPSKPLSISTYKRARRVLEECGFLGLVASAWTSSLRAGALDDGTGTCAVFVLTVPRHRGPLPADGDSPRVNEPLTGSHSEPGKAPRAREDRLESGALGQARDLQRRAPVLTRISAEAVRHMIKPFAAAGWTARDVLEAIDHAPDGRQHGFTSSVRHPAGWLRSRLSAWLAPDGAVRPSVSQQRAASAAVVRAGQAARRERERAVRAAAASPQQVRAHAAAAREALRARKTRAA